MKKAFTLLELLLVIAIISVISGLIIFNLRPAEILQDANSLKTKKNSTQIEDAIKAYTLDHNGALPSAIASLASGTYDICQVGQGGCTLQSIDLEELVTLGYLSTIPKSTGCTSSSKSCLQLTYNVNKISTIVSEEPPVVTCATGYVLVPGNQALYGTSDFCVMQYEAKYDCTGDRIGDIATTCSAPADAGSGLDRRDITSFSNTNVLSTPEGAPIVHISHMQARTSCPSGSHLINNNEWMTIARNIEAQSANWGNGVIGSMVSSGGGLKRGNVSLMDSISYDGANPEQGTGRDTKARHILSNGQYIWDLSGNIDEFTDNQIVASDQPTGVTPGFAWRELTDLVTYGTMSYDLVKPSNNTWNAVIGSDEGVGRIYTDGSPSNFLSFFFRRGGSWSDQHHAGVFKLTINNSSSDHGVSFGFRCSYNP